MLGVRSESGQQVPGAVEATRISQGVHEQLEPDLADAQCARTRQQSGNRCLHVLVGNEAHKVELHKTPLASNAPRSVAPCQFCRRGCSSPATTLVPSPGVDPKQSTSSGATRRAMSGEWVASSIWRS